MICEDFPHSKYAKYCQQQPVNVYIQQKTSRFWVLGNVLIQDIKFSGINQLGQPGSQYIYIYIYYIYILENNIIEDKDRNLHFPLCFSNPLRSNNDPRVKIKCEIKELICPTQIQYERMYEWEYEDTESTVEKYPNSLFVLYPTRVFTIGRNFTSIPHLTIKKSQFEYFLDGMDSLIGIWEGIKLDYYRTYYDQNKGGKITIQDSTFHYSRFCKGLIAYNYWKNKMHPERNWEIYAESETSKTNEDRLSYMLIISGSEFKYLNYHNERKMVKRLNVSIKGDIHHSYTTYASKLDFFDDDIYVSLHKGSVLNLQGFPGSIYITNSQFMYIYYILYTIYYIYIYIYCLDRTRIILKD